MEVLNKKQDAVIEGKKLDTQIAIQELQKQVRQKELQSTLLAEDREKFLLWFPRALFYLTGSAYLSALFFVSTFDIHTWIVLELPEDMKYIPYSLVALWTLDWFKRK